MSKPPEKPPLTVTEPDPADDVLDAAFPIREDVEGTAFSLEEFQRSVREGMLTRPGGSDPIGDSPDRPIRESREPKEPRSPGTTHGTFETPICTGLERFPRVHRIEVSYLNDRNVDTAVGPVYTTTIGVGGLAAHFPDAMPGSGKDRMFIFRGATASGVIVQGAEWTQSVSGDAPEVRRAKVAGTPGTSSIPNSGLSLIERELASALERVRADEAKRLDAALLAAKRQEEMLALERRGVAEREKMLLTEATTAERQRHEFAMAEASRRHKEDMEERDRRNREDRDREAERRKEEREREADRRKEEREERDRADARRREDAAAEKDRDRQFQERMAGMAAASTLETTLGKLGTMATAMGINPGAILEKFMNPATPGGGEGVISALAPVFAKVVEVGGNIAQSQIDIQRTQADIAARQAGVEVRQRPPAPRPPPRQLPQLPPAATTPTPAATPAPKPPPAVVKPPVVSPPPQGAGVTPQGAPPAVAPPLAVAPDVHAGAKARLRALCDKLKPLPEAQWQAQLLPLATDAEIVTYLKGTGVHKAARAAGCTYAQSVKLDKAITPFLSLAG